MANTKLKSNLEVNMSITLELTLEEAKALNEMVGYGSKAFLEGYYKQLGKSYLQPHEKGVISLFKTVKETLPHEIHQANKIVNMVNEVRELNKK